MRADSGAPIVAVAVLRDADDRIVLLQRVGALIEPDTWEFPGGKVEEGETVEAGLARELDEELGIVPLSTRLILSRLNHYEGGVSFDLRYFLVDRWSGEIESREGRPICRQPRADLGEIIMVSGNAEIMALLIDLA